MSTMDIIKYHGGEPANFLDVGGGVNKDEAIEAFRILLSDPQVKGVLVNIFGGIAKCDMIAEALVKAGREVGFKVPVVVRLEGTNVEQGREILAAARAELPTIADGDGPDRRGEEGGGGGEGVRQGGRAMATVQTKLMTAEEFYEWANRPENRGRICELERGVIVEMSRPGKRHGICSGHTSTWDTIKHWGCWRSLAQVFAPRRISS